ncbi:MAG: LamG-like jellyroll fold domain-containing protein [Verrucomicrobiota bacterium]|nr:hypothetical protein [Limisphaera sp.]MDW8381250.1 LamG-like jellyroll fold domain-containing protein [Verrucomicrobiota bacterium]
MKDTILCPCVTFFKTCLRPGLYLFFHKVFRLPGESAPGIRIRRRADWWRLLVAWFVAPALHVGASESPIILEAEAGLLGAEWERRGEGDQFWISILSNGTGSHPIRAERVATYTVTFPAPGTYELYVRLRVGPGTWNDDSFFYANEFNPRSPTNGADWVTVNGLASAGFTNPADVVQGRGFAGSGVWKWVNLSQYTNSGSEAPRGFVVSSSALVQIFQIGGREDGLEIDKLAFGPAGYRFTVADLDAGRPGQPPRAVVQIRPEQSHQVIEGMGGALCFYNGWIRAHPYKEEIYAWAFAGLNLSMLRLGNWFRYQATPQFDLEAAEFVARARQLLGRPVRILMSSWSPPAFLKSNGQTGNGGTLVFTNGAFAYGEFAQYWYDALAAYRLLGVNPTWISIQNEPDWEAPYDSCIFRPVEGFFNGTNWAGYPEALAAVAQRLAGLSNPPRLLAPEPVGIGYNVLQNYATRLDGRLFYGLAYHLYHGSTDGTADGYIPALRASTNLFPSKPRFMTEYGVSNMIECATLIHNCLTEGLVSGYNHWSLIWPEKDGGLIQIEFPWDRSRWTNAPPGTPTQARGYWLSPAYWAMKHYSFFLEPDSVRVGASSSDSHVRVSAFVTPGRARLICVLIHRDRSVPTIVTLDPGEYSYRHSAVYQTTSTEVYHAASTNRFALLGPLGAELILPPESLTTVVFEGVIDVEPATEPNPGNGAVAVPWNTPLTWRPGNLAGQYAVYMGQNSNAVAQAHPGSPEFRGVFHTNWYHPGGLEGHTTYFWRVDTIVGANTNRGVVWSFTTAAASALRNRYRFDEQGGIVFGDSEGGPVWNGTLPNGGVLMDGMLTLSPAGQQYGLLPPGILSGLSNVTIAAWVRLRNVANWTRIFDFGQNTTTNMFLTPRSGASGRLRFAITTSGSSGEQRIDAAFGLTTGMWYHVVVTLEGSRGLLYVNGTPVGTNTALTLRPRDLGVTTNNYLGRSQYTADPYLDGVLEEFRIYRVALTPQEVAALYALGPDGLLTEAPPVLRISLAGTAVRLSWPLAHAGFSLQARTDLTEDSWQAVRTAVPLIREGRWEVLMPVTNGPGRFFRLVR